jgi:hypothetical protein
VPKSDEEMQEFLRNIYSPKEPEQTTPAAVTAE